MELMKTAEEMIRYCEKHEFAMAFTKYCKFIV